jgi:hypothetical protein
MGNFSRSSSEAILGSFLTGMYSIYPLKGPFSGGKSPFLSSTNPFGSLLLRLIFC